MLNLGRLPRALRLGLYGLAVVILLYITLAPQQDVPTASLFSDKVEHAAGWFVLTVLGLLLSPVRPRAIIAFALTLGVAVEIAQSLMPFGRQGDWRDFVADVVGVAAAVILWRFRRR